MASLFSQVARQRAGVRIVPACANTSRSAPKQLLILSTFAVLIALPGGRSRDRSSSFVFVKSLVGHMDKRLRCHIQRVPVMGTRSRARAQGGRFITRHFDENREEANVLLLRQSAHATLNSCHKDGSKSMKGGVYGMDVVWLQLVQL